MHSTLPFTTLLNRIFAGPVTALLHALGLHPHNPAAPIPDFVAMQILVVGLLVMVFAIVRANLSVENPSGLQHAMEGLYGFISDMSSEIVGRGHERFDSFLTALGLFILSANLIGMIPSFESPTAVPSVPLGCALVAWFYYHTQGFRQNGLGYLKHFMGPVLGLSWLLFPIELISHLARIMSLTVRLFANIFAGDMLILAFFSLIPIGVPIVFLLLHLGVSLIQTYIFVLLAAVYLSEAAAIHDEHEPAH
jgi:F-type H+-transporting ATPase subunit a